MAPTSNIAKLLTKLAKSSKKSTSSRVKVPWRCKPRAPLKLTAADKAVRQLKRKQNADDIDKFLADAREANWDCASTLAEKYGHSKAYWYKHMISAEHLKFKLGVEPCKILRWNVFVSQELTKRNDSKCLLILHYLPRARATNALTRR